MSILYISDITIFVIFLINILYLFVFSTASLFKSEKTNLRPKTKKRVAILIPSYKEDTVISECVESCLNQQYDRQKYDIVVISDRMSDQTNESLSRLPIKLVKVYFENSTKSKALNFAMNEIGDNYDIAVILDADNTISPSFLEQINEIFANQNVEIVQAHRCAKNINTPLALLDALSEEINNGIFRKGHSKLGLSAALIGSGMAFDYHLFKNTMLTIDAIGGFDRALELTLLYKGKRIYYLPHTDVLDEKVQQSTDFARQRRRWLSAQIHYLGRAIGQIPTAISQGRWDFCDKVFQQMSIPRVMLLGFCFIIATVLSLTTSGLAPKWWAIFSLLILSLLMAVPRKLYTKQLFMAIIQLPYFFTLMVLNIFKMKGANKKFIHTKHGVK